MMFWYSVLAGKKTEGKFSLFGASGQPWGSRHKPLKGVYGRLRYPGGVSNKWCPV